jgi:hypothetical protein
VVWHTDLTILLFLLVKVRTILAEKINQFVKEAGRITKKSCFFFALKTAAILDYCHVLRDHTFVHGLCLYAWLYTSV